MIQLRWIVPDKTTTNAPILQWRDCFAVDASGALCPGTWTEWLDVPRVVLPVDAKRRVSRHDSGGQAMTDKTVAELMSLADNWALSAGDSAVCGDESLPMQCETRAALEQAIRRAVEWGEPVAYAPADVLAELKTTNSGLMLSSDDYAVPLVPLYARNKP